MTSDEAIEESRRWARDRVDQPDDAVIEFAVSEMLYVWRIHKLTGRDSLASVTLDEICEVIQAMKEAE